MTYDQYLALGFGVLFASFALGFKSSIAKKLSAIFSVSFLLQAVVGFFNQEPISILLLFYSYLLISVAFFYGLSITRTVRALANKAYTDQLTKVNNRTFLEDILKKELRHYETLGINYCVVFIDMFNFKKVNDAYGHTVGDRVLAEVGQRLRKSVRSDDFVVRYGGDEFLVVLKDVKEDRINSVIERLRENLNFDAEGIQVRANIGYAIYPKDGKSLEELIKVSIERMYEDKKAMENE
ncbi:MAG: GGDEF domain-containing protein [Hydrogenobacter thermophilus]|uniref:GGDEF domain-containing protein n=1 Tax=Hydrogenobacter thermophilus TaxID=940 RepID=UPI001C7859A9|nr:GGDEF domain-containing protein [Hydrogenobacter thermophilus]QWK20339.1 MAG: GGDEF domain-containing protein [Hydrogenobacter thermophilus]